MPAALIALLAALGQLPAPQLAQPGETVTLRADLAELDTAEDRLQAEGHVLLESGRLRLFSQELEYALRTRDGSAGGGVLLFDGTLVVNAREGSFNLQEGGRLKLEGAELWQKAPAALPALESVTDAATARRTGRNLLLLEAARLERVSRGKFLAHELRLTPCDCGERTSPDWSLSASEADVEPGERAILWWPVLHIKDVPVFILPALYVPLSNRRTGFLFPRPGYHAQSGFFVDEPFFWAIDDSHDLTLTVGWRFGVDRRLDPASLRHVRVGAQGPRGAAELRYLPAEHTYGRLYLAAGYDLHGDPAPDGLSLRPARGWRGELSWRHGTDVAGFSARSDLRFVSDANYLGDQVADVLGEAPPYLRSQAWLGYRGRAASAALSGAWYQDMGGPFSAPERWFFGDQAPAGYQRPLALDVSVPRAALVGPLRAGLEVHAARVQALSLLAGPVPQGALASSRLDLLPTVSLPLQAGSILSAELYAGARGDLASYTEAGPEPRTAMSARAFAGAWAGTELSRTFESGLRHTIEPALELRAATQRFGDELGDTAGATRPLDEFDERPDGFVQGVVSVATRLVRAGAGELGRLEVGQGVDVGKGRAADSFGRLVVNPPYSQLTSSARWDWQRKAFSAVSASLRLFDPRQDSLELRYDRLMATGTGQTRASLDALFGATRYARAADGPELAFNQVTLSLAISIYQGIAVRYGAALVPDMPAPFIQRIIQHTAGVTLSTSCECWRVDAYMTYVANSGPSFGFLVDLKLRPLTTQGIP